MVLRGSNQNRSTFARLILIPPERSLAHLSFMQCEPSLVLLGGPSIFRRLGTSSSSEKGPILGLNQTS